jgi:hypothetical protein
LSLSQISTMFVNIPSSINKSSVKFPFANNQYSPANTRRPLITPPQRRINATLRNNRKQIRIEAVRENGDETTLLPPNQLSIKSSASFSSMRHSFRRIRALATTNARKTVSLIHYYHNIIHNCVNYYRQRRR